MALLSVPLLSLRLGMSDAGTNAPTSTERQAYDLLADGFGPGFNGPLTLVVDLTAVADKDAALTHLAAAVRAEADIAAVGQAARNPTGDTAVLTAVPASSPSSAATESLIHRLRDRVVPSVESTTGAVVQITGSTAANIDISAKIGSALPKFMAIVIGLTMLLLLVVFRSLFVPVKAAIAILFGLSMDYEVFILSRIKEDYSRTGEARPAVLSGLTASARVITAAALIMISVFASFVLGDDSTIKMFGIGLAAAVLLDATVVRMIIVPAVMSLAGKAAWWLPQWLDRSLPNLDVEGEALMTRLEAEELELHTGMGEPVLLGADR